MKLKISIAVLLAMAPAFAQAKPRSPTGHMRPQLFHDRTPKGHTHEAHVHEAHLPPPKSPPPPPPTPEDLQ